MITLGLETGMTSTERNDGKPGAPESLDRARLMLRFRNCPISKRPPWVERRAAEMAMMSA